METRGRSEHKRRGGKRKDRVFRIYVELPPGVDENDFMDYAEEAITSYWAYCNPSSTHGEYLEGACVKRHSVNPYKK